jgi:DNA-binding NarL/FixJ family response regulator
MISVAIADDHGVVRLGLASLLGLSSDIAVVGEAGDGQATVELVARQRPDVLLLDVRMPCGDGLWVLRELAARGLLLPTLVLTTFEDDEVTLQAVALGARGYLLKNVTLDRLLEAVRALASGATYIRPAVGERTERVLGAAARASGVAGVSIGPDPEISRREREVLRLLAGGYSNREIARALHVAEGTIKNHVSSILDKMGVRDRTRAVLKAAEWGWL